MNLYNVGCIFYTIEFSIFLPNVTVSQSQRSKTYVQEIESNYRMNDLCLVNFLVLMVKPWFSWLKLVIIRTKRCVECYCDDLETLPAFAAKQNQQIFVFVYIMLLRC